MDDNPNKLESARQRIESVDKELIRLLKQRMDAVQLVAKHKSDDQDATLYDPEREARVVHDILA